MLLGLKKEKSLSRRPSLEGCCCCSEASSLGQAVGGGGDGEAALRRSEDVKPHGISPIISLVVRVSRRDDCFGM